MTFYSYVCTSARGETVTGSLEAESAQAARAALRQMDFEVRELKEQKPSDISAPLDAVRLAPAPPPPPVPAAIAAKPVQIPALLNKRSGTPVTFPLSQVYMPLLSTVRIYAGWLLAWYFLIYSVSSYQLLGKLPVRIPFIQELFASTLILGFCAGAFLLMLLTSIHRLLGGGHLKGLALSFAGLILLVFYMQNV